jgi:hypothetical protein
MENLSQERGSLSDHEEDLLRRFIHPVRAVTTPLASVTAWRRQGRFITVKFGVGPSAEIFEVDLSSGDVEQVLNL